MVDIIHRVGIKASPADVYAALSTVDGVAGWWTRETTGESRVGGTITVRFLDDGEGGKREARERGRMVLEVTRLESGRAVDWRVTDGPPEWIGTDVTFTLAPGDGQTLVLFGHRRWREATEFTAHCSMKWATFLLSLKQLAETGTGRPSPDDMKIDNWN